MQIDETTERGAVSPKSSCDDVIELFDHAELPLRVLGDFQIVRELGRGGMSVVFEAIQLSLDADYKGFDVRHYQTNEKGHGRIQTRHYYQSSIPESVREQTDQRSKMKTLCQVINLTERDGKETSEVRYYISSLSLGVKRLASAARGHWSIENSLHWVLDGRL